MMEVLNIAAIVVAGLMVGSELTIAAFVHPTLDQLPDNVHLPVAAALARVLGRFMPFWYVLVLLLTLAEVLFQWRQSSRLPIWVVTSGDFVGVGDCVFHHRFGAHQQSHCILGKGSPACRLEDFSMQMGHASPVASCAPHDSFRVSDRGSILNPWNLRRGSGWPLQRCPHKSVTAGVLPPRSWSTAAWAMVAACSVLFTYALTFTLGFLFLAFGCFQAAAMVSHGNYSILGFLLLAFALIVGGSPLHGARNWRLAFVVSAVKGFGCPLTLDPLDRCRQTAGTLMDACPFELIELA